MKKALYSLTLAGLIIGTSIAFANPPTIVIDPIPDMELASFPLAYDITGTVIHDSSTGPGVKNVCRLIDMLVTVSDGINPAITLLSTADPVTYFGWSPTCAISDSWTLPWSITAPGTYTVTASIKHVGATGSDSEVTVITEEVTVVDSTPPVITSTITPDANGNGWHNSPVTISWSVMDDESTISSTTGCETTILSDDTIGTIVTCSATSEGGTASESVTIMIDQTAPIVTITTPADGADYTFKSVVAADWSATDATSGIDTLISTTANGGAITTNPIGAYSYTVTATDLAGNSTSVTNSYEVIPYTFVGWQAPLTVDSKTFKKSSTIPVKFKIAALSGFVPDAVATLTVDGVPAISSGQANTDNFFRYDYPGDQYIFNLSTKMPVLTIGTHTLSVTLDDGSAPRVYSITVK